MLAFSVLVSVYGQWAGPLDLTGRNKTLPPFTSLPFVCEITGVNTASLGGCLHNSKTRARWAEGFLDVLNSHVFDLERDRPVMLYFAMERYYYPKLFRH